MAKKKSYMNTSTLVAEGFFSKLFKKIKDRKTFNKIKKDNKPFSKKKITLAVYKDFLKRYKV